jgi:hypothetical protein
MVVKVVSVTCDAEINCCWENAHHLDDGFWRTLRKWCSYLDHGRGFGLVDTGLECVGGHVGTDLLGVLVEGLAQVVRRRNDLFPWPDRGRGWGRRDAVEVRVNVAAIARGTSICMARVCVVGHALIWRGYIRAAGRW